VYLLDRWPGEILRRFCSRHSDEELRRFLAGHMSEAVARDLPAGPVPHGVDG
jgi:sulfite reductase (ferredoxin)